MGLLHPVRSTLAALDGLVDRLVCAAGAALFSQAPEFMQQYLQRLGGHLDEARRQLAQFQAVAARAGLSLDQFARYTAGNADSRLARLGPVIQGAARRVNALAADQAAIRGATLWSRPFVFVAHADPKILRATWGVFRPAVPTTLEGLVYAAAGLLLLLGFYHGAVRYPVRHGWRRWRSRRSALRSARAGASLPLA